MKDAGKKSQMLLTLMAYALVLGVCAGAASAKELNGYYVGDDGGAYFIRQIGDKVYWFGEDPNGRWANVLTGTIDGTMLRGRFWDVPKGKTKGIGEITLVITNDGAALTKLSSTVPFGTRT